MRSRILVGTLVLVGAFSASALATRGDGAGPTRRWAIVNFVSPVQLEDQYLMGQYLIIHDDAKMERGEACTSFYRFDPATGPKEQVAAFHCRPVPRELCEQTRISVRNSGLDIPRLVEYQFAGDIEGHGVPLK
jgi:hypothetical protein